MQSSRIVKDFILFFHSRYCSRICRSFSEKSLRVCFFGSDFVSLPTLRELDRNMGSSGIVKQLRVFGSAGWKSSLKTHFQDSCVQKYCSESGLEFTPIPKMKSLEEWKIPDDLYHHEYDVCVVASFGYFLPPTLLDCFRYGGYNMHPSLLPKYRGAAPIQRAILANETRTGVSIIQLSSRVIDSGGIVYQRDVNIHPNDAFEQLASQLANLGADMMIHVLNHRDTMIAYIQSELYATKAPKITKEMSIIHWKTQTAQHIFSLFKAISYSFPIRTQWNEKHILLKSIRLMDADCLLESSSSSELNSLHAGECFYWKKGRTLVVRAMDGWIAVDSLQILPKSQVFSSHVLASQFTKRIEKFSDI